MPKYVIIFNTTDRSIPRDEEGRVIEPYTHGVAEESYVHVYIENGELIVIDPEVIDNFSSLGSKMAKQEYIRLNDVKAKADTGKSTKAKK